MNKILDIQLFRTEEGYKIESTGYHDCLPQDNILPCDTVFNNADDIYKKFALLIRAQLQTQKVLDEQGYEGLKAWCGRYKTLDNLPTLS